MPLTKVTSSLINTISASQIQASGASAGQILAYDGSTWVATASGSSGIIRGTAVTLTNQTSVDFTGIPSTAKRVTVTLSGVSTSGTSLMLIQAGTSAGMVTTGYTSSVQFGPSNSSYTAGLLLTQQVAAATVIHIGTLTLTNITGNAWVGVSIVSPGINNGSSYGAGSITLSGALDRIRLTTVNGTDQFDAGIVNIMWE